MNIDENGAPAAVTISATVGPGMPNNGKNFMITLPLIGYQAEDDAVQTTQVFVQIDKDKVEKLGDATSKNKAKTATLNLVRQESANSGTVDPGSRFYYESDDCQPHWWWCLRRRDRNGPLPSEDRA